MTALSDALRAAQAPFRRGRRVAALEREAVVLRGLLNQTNSAVAAANNDVAALRDDLHEVALALDATNRVLAARTEHLA